MSIIITCEHAGNTVPAEYGFLFREAPADLLESHRGWDPGAWDVARSISERLHLPLYGCHTTRLLIEVNRSPWHNELFSEFTRGLGPGHKEGLMSAVYKAYRDPIEQFIRHSGKPVLHFSIHSFTPVLNQQTREMEMGLLYDPSRRSEQEYVERISRPILKALPEMRIAFNEPYKGVDDGFTTYLRSCFADEHYSGIEVELNQKLLGTWKWKRLNDALSGALSLIQATS